jgi:hypothetical protein
MCINSNEYRIPFNKLNLDKSYIAQFLGYSDGIIPEPFSDDVEEAFAEALQHCDIRGAFYMSETCQFADDWSHLIVDGVKFDVGKTVAKELRNSEKIAIFICTAGRRLSERSSQLLAENNPVLGYILDLLGSMIVESATDHLQETVFEFAKSINSSITNRYSPGYCKWSVSDQRQLFSFFPENCCGICLTDSSLMYPIKSVSGIIGIGKMVKFRKYTCDLCSQVDCSHRNFQQFKSNKFQSQ